MHAEKKKDQLQRGRKDNSPVPEQLGWLFHRNRLLCDEGLKSPVAEKPQLCLFMMLQCHPPGPN